MWSLATYTYVEPMIAMNAIDIRGSFKRTVDNADLNESGESVHRLKKAQRVDQYAGTSPCACV